MRANRRNLHGIFLCSFRDCFMSDKYCRVSRSRAILGNLLMSCRSNRVPVKSSARRFISRPILNGARREKLESTDVFVFRCQPTACGVIRLRGTADEKNAGINSPVFAYSVAWPLPSAGRKLSLLGSRGLGGLPCMNVGPVATACLCLARKLTVALDNEAIY